MIRAFVGVRIDRSVVEALSRLQSELRSQLGGLRWVALQNLHLTLKFFGEVSDAKIPLISAALEEVGRSLPRFSMESRGIGVFPDIKNPRVLWVGVEARPLVMAAEAVEAAVEPLGFEREKRAFEPHLTVGRWRQFNGLKENLRQAIERWKDVSFGTTQVEELILFQSALRPEGAVYSPLHVVRMG